MAVRVVYKLPNQNARPIDLGDDQGAHFECLSTMIGGTLWAYPAPQGCPVADVRLYVDDNGLARQLPYNTVGLVGPVIAYKLAPDGEVLGLADAEVTVLMEWLDADERPVRGSVFARPTSGESSGPTFRLPPHARRADDYEATGGTAFDPQLHFTGAQGDAAERALVQRLLDRHGSQVIAYADERTPGFCGFPSHLFFSLELQFADTPAGRAAMTACLSEYRDGPQADRRKNRKRKNRRKRKGR